MSWDLNILKHLSNATYTQSIWGYFRVALKEQLLELLRIAF